MRSEFIPLLENYKREAQDDIIGLWQFISHIKRVFHTETETQIMDFTLEFVKVLLVNGFEAIDSPYLREGYHRWLNQDVDYVIERIRTEWKALGRTPNIGDIVWFGLISRKLGQ